MIPYLFPSGHFPAFLLSHAASFLTDTQSAAPAVLLPVCCSFRPLRSVLPLFLPAPAVLPFSDPASLYPAYAPPVLQAVGDESRHRPGMALLLSVSPPEFLPAHPGITIPSPDRFSADCLSSGFRRDMHFVSLPVLCRPIPSFSADFPVFPAPDGIFPAAAQHCFFSPSVLLLPFYLPAVSPPLFVTVSAARQAVTLHPSFFPVAFSLLPK